MVGMADSSLRTQLFERYSQLQVWLLSRIICIKRIGYFSLRHIVFNPKQGVEVRIGKIGISPHRPTVARPGFLTFVICNLEIVVDPNVTIEQDAEESPRDPSRRGSAADTTEEQPTSDDDDDAKFAGIPLFPRRKPKLFKIVRWLVKTMKVFDVQFYSVSLVFTDVMSIILTSINCRLDLRKTRNYNVSNFVGTLDTYKLSDGELPINAKLSITDVYLAESLEDESPWQASEDLRFDVMGVLELAELRAKEVGVQMQCGRIQLDIAQITEMLNKVKKIRAKKQQQPESSISVPFVGSSSNQQQQRQDQQQQQQKSKVFSPKDKKRIVHAAVLLLHLVHRVQLNVGIVEVLRVPVDTAFFATRMKDMNLDLSRMNSQSSGFKLHYKEGDTAHQSIFTVASVTAGIDTGTEQEEIFYIPLITSLTRGNLFSQTLQFVRECKDSNDAVLKSGWVVHSPNVSIEEHQISTLVRVALGLDAHGKSKENFSTNSSSTPGGRSDSPGATSVTSSMNADEDEKVPLYKLLPNIDLDLTVSDPAFRLVCHRTSVCQDAIFAVTSSRAHMALKSTHNRETNSYSGVAVVETFGDRGYYHSNTANMIEIIGSEMTQLTVKASTLPQFNMSIEGKQSDLHITALRHEIFCAIGQLHATIRRPIREWRKSHKIPRRKRATTPSSDDGKHEDVVHKGKLIRGVPKFVSRMSFETSNSSMTIATNQFRGQTNDIFGIRFTSQRFGLLYESGLCEEKLGDPKVFAVESDTDGRRLKVSGSEIKLFKANRVLLGELDDDENVGRRNTVAQMPSLQVQVRTHNTDNVTIEVNIEPRLRIDLNINLILAFSVVREILGTALLHHAEKVEAASMEVDVAHKQSQQQQKQRLDKLREKGAMDQADYEKTASVAAATTVQTDVDADSDGEYKDAPQTISNDDAKGDEEYEDAASVLERELEEEQAAQEKDAIDHPQRITRELHNIILTMPRALIKIDMPSDDQVMLELGASTVRRMAKQDPCLQTKTLKLYSQHPFKRISWCILASLVNVNGEYAMAAKAREDKIKLNLDGMRINVPYQFKLYRIIDNGITLAKAIKTLNLQTKLMDWMIALDPHKIEGVPHIPRIRLKTQQLQLALEDDYFESDLTLIMLNHVEVGSLRRQKLYHLDYRIKAMLRDGLRAIERVEEDEPRPLKGKQQQHHHHQHHSNASVNETLDNFEVGEKVAQAAGNFRRTANNVFDIHHGDSRSNGNQHQQRAQRKPHHSQQQQNAKTDMHDRPDDPAQGYSRVLYNALRHVPRHKIEELLDTGLELGCPSDDGDPVLTENHVWLDFWSSPDFADFRKQKVPQQDGSPSKMTIDEVRIAYLEDQSRMWVETIKRERNIQHLGTKKRRNEVFTDNFDPNTCAEENIIDYTQKPLSMSVDFRHLDLVLDTTTYDTKDKLHKFLYEIGKGQPMDSEFSILVPLYIDLRAHGGLRVDIKDFPLPVLHFPALARSQDPNTNLALQIKGDMIITEQLMTSEQNMRKLFVPLRTLTREKQKIRGSDVLEVHRTLTPIKTFTNLKFHVGSTVPTRVTWCMAYKPGLHSVGEAFSGFSKPPIDPSPALGFWDKIRLVLHARFDFELPKSPLCLCIKAGKSPYELLGDASGFVFTWRENTHVQINPEDDPRNLFMFKSDVFELTVPNYLEWEKEFLNATPGERSLPRSAFVERVPTPEKVVFSFAQKTRWQLGMIFQKLSDHTDHKHSALLESRDSKFRNHYDVQMCMPEYIEDKENYDAYHGFRSDFIHMAINVVSRPVGGPDLGTGESNWAFGGNSYSGANKCTAHLTQGVLRHFRFWKNQFSGEQWPPIKTGSLFPDPVRARPSKKTFSTALSTAQYQIALSPLDLSFFHQMRHHSAVESHDRVTGLKAKIDDFVFDWHTRREPPHVTDENGHEKVLLSGHRRWRMKSHLGEVRLDSVQVRVVDATLRTQSSKAALRALYDDDNSDSDEDDDASETGSTTDDNQGSTYGSSRRVPSGTQATSSGGGHYGPRYLGDDFWVDMDDYTEVNVQRNLRSRTPDVKSYPFLYTPRFCYLRSTDFSGRSVYVDPEAKRKVPKFGDIDVHECLITSEQPERVQADLLDRRRNHVKERISDFKMSLESLDNYQGKLTPDMKRRVDDLKKFVAIGELNTKVLHHEMLNFYALAENADEKYKNLKRNMDEDLRIQMRGDDTDGKSQDFALEDPEWKAAQENVEGIVEGDFSLFRNRYIIHAMHLKWNNTVRNLLFRLQSTLSEDKELEYVRCRRAVQYLEELVAKAEEKARGEYPHRDSTAGSQAQSSHPPHQHGHSGGEEEDEYLRSEQHSYRPDHDDGYEEEIDFNHKMHLGDSVSRQSTRASDGADTSRRGSAAWDNQCHHRLQSLFEDLRDVKEGQIAEKAHSVSFLTPRIQLIAEENPSKCLQVLARDIEVQVIDTYCNQASMDSDSARIERRYGAVLNKSGFFVLGEEDVERTGIESLCLEQYSGEEENNKSAWPPWLSMELCYDPLPLKQFAIIEDVSFGVRYDQPNDLHVASEGEGEEEVELPGEAGTEDADGQSASSTSSRRESTGGSSSSTATVTTNAATAAATAGGNGYPASRVPTNGLSRQETGETAAKNGESKGGDKEAGDLAEGTELSDLKNPELKKTLKHHGNHKGKALLSSLVVDAPRIVVNVDSVQFYTFYMILVDLLTYRDPLIKKREEAIDRIFLSNDFKGDYRATVERVELLQKDIRSLLHLREKLMIIALNNNDASRETKIHLIKLEREAIRRMTQLTVLIRAFKAVLRKNMNSAVEKLTKWSLLADSLLLHILSETGKPMVEVYIRRVHYSKLSNDDLGSLNRATLSGVYARNLLPGATYPMMLANYESDKYNTSQEEAVKLKWTRLDKVGGIPVLDDAEVKLKPLHIQMEHGIFRKVLDFAFPIKNLNDGKDDEKGSVRSVSDSEDEDDDDLSDSDESLAISEFDDKNSKQNSKSKSKSGPHGLLHKLSRKSKHHHHKHDVDEMMNRASNYWSIRSLKIYPTQLTVSYKGKARYSLLNLQNIQLPLPMLTISNKTVTKLDLIMRIKKMAVKTLLGQSGSILSNKFKKHKAHAAEDDRDLGLEKLQTGGSTDLQYELNQLNADVQMRDDSQHMETSTEIHSLVPLHREIAQADPQHAREITLETLTGSSSEDNSRPSSSLFSSVPNSKGTSRTGTPGLGEARSSFQSHRSLSIKRANQADAPGSPRRLRAASNRQSAVYDEQVNGKQRRPSGSSSSALRPKRSSTFMEKLKKGLHHNS